MSNFYENPEQFGMTILNENGGYNKDYTFRITLLIYWDKRYWFITDTGASVPYPFDDMTAANLCGGWSGSDISAQPAKYRAIISKHYSKHYKSDKIIHTKKGKRK